MRWVGDEIRAHIWPGALFIWETDTHVKWTVKASLVYTISTFVYNTTKSFPLEHDFPLARKSMNGRKISMGCSQTSLGEPLSFTILTCFSLVDPHTYITHKARTTYYIQPEKRAQRVHSYALIAAICLLRFLSFTSISV